MFCIRAIHLVRQGSRAAAPPGGHSSLSFGSNAGAAPHPSPHKFLDFPTSFSASLLCMYGTSLGGTNALPSR
jgi:hypothetical protein